MPCGRVEILQDELPPGLSQEDAIHLVIDQNCVGDMGTAGCEYSATCGYAFDWFHAHHHVRMEIQT